MTDFKREWRYIVVKRKHITEDQEAQLISLTNSFNLPNLECAVVESDWPEYETVWKMVEDRVTGRSTQPQAYVAVAGLVERLRENDQEIFLPLLGEAADMLERLTQPPAVDVSETPSDCHQPDLLSADDQQADAVEAVAWMYTYPGAFPSVRMDRAPHATTWTETPLYDEPTVLRRIADAVESERKACAEVADRYRDRWCSAGGFGGHSAGARIIRDTILERGGQS